MYFITLKRFRPWQIEFTIEKGIFPNFAPIILSFWTLLALKKELHINIKNKNCSPKCQLKVEPSTVIIHAQIDEIYHLKSQKTASQLAFLLGKRYLCPWMNTYNNK